MRVGRIVCGLLPALLISPALSADGDAGSEWMPAAELKVATRVPRPTADGASSGRSPGITLSDGWGCASFDSEQGRFEQCWDAGPKPRAFAVPWLKGPRYVARDRVCKHEMRELTFRCWHRPRRGEVKPREMPARWQWLNPHGAKWDDVYNRSDRLESVFMGATFACLRTTKDDRVFCLGDDRFGQLGSSAPPGPNASADDPAFLRGVGPEVSPALGTWHGCGLALPRAHDEAIPVMCWGRGDHGQLGAPAPDRCAVGGRSVPCARKPVPGPLVGSQMAVLKAGDLFTCVTTITGIKCWGASRDGLFGVRGSCPEALRRAWPTLDGPVAALDASCTTTPVDLPGATEFDPHFTVSPRQICYASAGQQRCLSGVPKPDDAEIRHTYVSPGSDASACARRGDGVVCWGDKYSPPGAPGQLVSIAFEPLPPLGDLATVGDNASITKTNCQIQRACREPVKNLPRCSGGGKARAASEVLAAAPTLAGQIVRVRGPLGVGRQSDGASSAPRNPIGIETKCDSEVECCRHVWMPVVLGGADNGTLALDGLHCSGDESRACCNAPAFGQTVVATGRLERGTPALGFANVAAWRLADVRVCEELGRTPVRKSP